MTRDESRGLLLMLLIVIGNDTAVEKEPRELQCLLGHFVVLPSRLWVFLKFGSSSSHRVSSPEERPMTSPAVRVAT